MDLSLRHRWENQVEANGFLYITGPSQQDVHLWRLEDRSARDRGGDADAQAVADVSVIGWPSREWGEIGLDISVPRAGMAIDDAEPDIVAAEPIAGNKAPKRVFVWSELPKSATGRSPRSWSAARSKRAEAW